MDRVKVFAIEGKEVLFGPSAVDLLPQKLKARGISQVFACTDEGLGRTGLFKGFVRKLEAQGLRVTAYTDIVPNPKAEDVMTGAAELVKSGADCVVGFGGGSSMDSAKLIGAVAGNEGDVLEYTTHWPNRRSFKQRRVFMAAIPTTAGTGSEMDDAAVIVNPEGNKLNVVDPQISYDLVVEDAQMVYGCPPSVTASCGIDALCHNFENYIGNPSMFFAPIALEAIKLAYTNLLGAYRKRGNLFYENLMKASCIGGLVMGYESSPAGVPVHAMGLPIATKYHIAHGASLSAILPYFLDDVIAGNPSTISNVARYLGVDGADDRIVAKRFVIELQELLIQTHLDLSHGLVANEDDLIELADMAVKSGTTRDNGILPYDHAMCVSLYRRAFNHELIEF